MEGINYKIWSSYINGINYRYYTSYILTDIEFLHRKLITLSHSGALTDYQKILTVDYEPTMQPDFDDIRFAYPNDDNIPYCLISKTDESTAEVWIKNNYNDGDTEIYMYYGNEELSSSSNGDDVFIQWHDTAIASYIDSAIVSNDNDIYYRTRLKMTGTTQFGLGKTTPIQNDDAMYIQPITSTETIYAVTSNDGNVSFKTTSPVNHGDDTYRIYEMVYLTGISLTGYYDDTPVSESVVTNLPTGELFGLQMALSSGTVIQDWAFAAKYTPIEPTYLFGEEE